MKRLFGLAAAFAITLNITSAFAQDWKNQYPWAVEAVEYCTSNGIIQGDEYGDLMLGWKLTRAQMAKIIAITFSLGDKGSNPYSDVDPNSWEYPYISAIAEYVAGAGNYYDGNGWAKREDFIVTIMKVCGAGEEDSQVLMKFADVSKTTAEYRGYLAAAVNAGILTGADGNIKPRTSLTRAEACTMLYRAAKHFNEEIKESNSSEPVDSNNGYDENSTDTTIVGKAKLTVEQAQAWAKDRGGSEKYINIAPTYWQLGEIMGIRPEILYAQAGWETNYGKYTGVVSEDMNNWAGIKVYGRTDDAKDAHETFATPEEGARGHFNHMAAYVGVEPYGEPHARYYSVKSLSWAGTVKTLEELGGKWCPDKEYGIKILNNCLIPMSSY